MLTSGLSFCFFIFCRVTNFLSSWQKFGHDDKKLVAMTIGIVAWPIFCHRDKNLVTMTIGIVAWPIFCHRDKNLVTMTIGIVIVTKFLSRWQKIGFETLIKFRWSSTRILVHWSNPHHHQVCLDIDKIPINIHQGRLDIWSLPKHPWWLLLGFHSCPNVLDEYWNLIYVQASLIMLIGILSTSKHP